MVITGDGGQVVDAGQDVLESMGPTTAVAGPPILKVPGGDAVRCEVPRKGLAELRAVLGPPVTAMDHNGDSTGQRRRAAMVSVGRFRYEEFAPLAGVFAVAVLVPQHCALLCTEPIVTIH